jgi:dephospho-CoA kinase
MVEGRPVIGIVGGIGSGKSFVAKLFGELGCLVISSDEQVREAYESDEVKSVLKQWWGESVFDAKGEVRKSAVAEKVFGDEAERTRLEQLLHPIVTRKREEVMRKKASDPTIKAFVWDTPLLLETGLEKQCDAVVFVEADEKTRLARVIGQRGWDAGELIRREKSQLGLDKKRGLSHHVIVNTADAAYARRQVQEVLSRILNGTK